jgi:hypothetical protein
MIMKKPVAGAPRFSAWPSPPHRLTETALLIPFLLLFMLLLLRPDLPDLRVAQMQQQGDSFSQNLALAFFAELLASLQPSHLSLGGSAYFRLFLKLLSVTVPLAFGFAMIKPRGGAAHRQSIVGLCVAIALVAQAVRFFIWGSGVSLLAVFALALGGLAGAWLEKWWYEFNRER